MVKYRTQIHQFSIISGIRQEANDRLTIVNPGSLFAPEARKGQLVVITEATEDLARGRDACQLVAKTLSKTFYADRSFSITSGLRRAIREANSALYEYNFRAAHHQKTAVGVSAAVLRGGDLYLAQVQPTQAYIAHAGRLRALPTHTTWNPGGSKATPFLPPNALGSSLFSEPDLRRNALGPGDTLVFCSTNLARLLGREEAERLFCYGDAHSALETLYNMCKRSSFSEAYTIIIEILPLLSPEAREAPLSPVGVGERGKVAARTIGGWLAGLTGEAALLVRRSGGRGQDGPQAEPDAEDAALLDGEEPPELAAEPEPAASGHTAAGQQLAGSQQPRATTSRRSAALEEPLPLSAMLGERLTKPPSAPQPRPTIDLSDHVPLPVDFAAIPKKQPLPPPTLAERLTMPFRMLLALVVTLFAVLLRRRRRPIIPEPPRFSEGGGLSYRRQRAPIPWRSMLLLAGIVTLAVVYGRLRLIETRQRDADQAIERATQNLQAARQATSEEQALDYLREVQAALTQAVETGVITTTDLQRWPAFVSLRNGASDLETSIMRANALSDLQIVATLPTSDTVSRLVVNPQNGEIYALGEQSHIIYRVAPGTRTAVPFFQEGTPAQTVTADIPQTFVWRVDAIAVMDRRAEASTIYLYNRDNPQNWFHNRLEGSQTWPPKTPDVESYGGNLYIWGAETGQILKYESGQYANPPQLWITDTGGQDLATAIDMIVDGQIYLLFADGRIAVLKQSLLDRVLPRPAVQPGIRIVTRLFASGDGPEQGNLYLLEPAEERVIELEKDSGALIQQLKAPASGPKLDQLRDLFVVAPADPSKKPTVYLANGNQILRATLPAPPPLRQKTPQAAPTTTRTP